MRTILELYSRPSRNASNHWANEMDRWFDEWFSSPTWAATERTKNFRPACDFEETESHYLLSLDIPGMRKEDFRIEVSGDTLTIEGERKQESRRAEENRYYSERVYGKFSRQFQFPAAVNSQNVEAEYENGVLRIALAKEATALPRRVEIKGEAQKPGLFEKLIGKTEKTVA